MNLIALTILFLLLVIALTFALTVYALVRVEALHHQVVQLRTYTQLDTFEVGRILPRHKQRPGPGMPPATARKPGGSAGVKI